MISEQELAEWESDQRKYDAPDKVRLRLIAEVRRLRALVEQAYRDGFNDCRCRDDGPPFDNEDGWQGSRCRKALEGIRD